MLEVSGHTGFPNRPIILDPELADRRLRRVPHMHTLLGETLGYLPEDFTCLIYMWGIRASYSLMPK